MQPRNGWLVVVVWVLLAGLYACGDDSGELESPLESEGDGGTPDAASPSEPADASKDDEVDASESSTGDAMDAGEGEACGDTMCDALATCEDDDDGEPVCVCADGYEGDGTECEDIDECRKADLNDCARRAKCENTPGGYTCECAAPAYEGDGKTCDCADGYERDDESDRCLASIGQPCEGGLDCISDECVDGVCCTTGCLEPGLCQTTEGATCEDGETCAYPDAPAGTDCADEDDDNCTSGTCAEERECVSSPIDVETVCGSNNPCVSASCDPETGCVVDPVSEGVDCDDGDPCTVTDSCDGTGLCLGTGLPSECVDDLECTTDACTADGDTAVCQNEPRTGSCTAPDSCSTDGMCDGSECVGVGNACGAGDPECTPGDPNTCECDEPEYVLFEGVCVPSINECTEGTTCVAEADCVDPSITPNDAVCTCTGNTVGDGLQDGTGCDPCASGRKAVDGQCVCDLTGTFAMRISTRMSWPAESGFLEGASDEEVYSFALQKLEYDDEGNLTVTERACGGDPAELCITFSDDHATLGKVDDDVWDSAGIRTFERDPVAMPDAVPGADYKTPPAAVVMGVTLPGDGLGAWPESRNSSGVQWHDTDADGVDGITTNWNGPDGPQPSPVCPRRDPDAERWDYNYPPGFDAIGRAYRIKEIYGATRLITSLNGQIDSCDRMSGAVEGRTPGSVPVTQARFLDCRLEDDRRCNTISTAIIGTYDDQPQPNDIDSATFILKRVDEDITCAEVRELSF